jgi:DNA-binding PadR family transcriptional regulator
VKHGLLALLERGPMHGYQLRVAFEESTGGTWPLNIGQVYTTLSRLEPDGLVRPRRRTTPGSGRMRSPTPAGPTWRRGSPPRSAAPTGPVTSWRSSWRWR